MQDKINNVTYLLIIIILGGYVLPWIIAPSAPLSLNAYDLAEWASLHPSQPNTTPPLIIPLLLRLQLVIVTLLIALYARTDIQRWIALILVALLAVAQLPPLEFLISERDNINYQQQFILATLSLLIGGGLVVRKPQRLTPIISIALVSMGIITSFSGLQQAQELYTLSSQEYVSGSGGVIVIIAYSIILAMNIYKIITKSQQPKLQTPQQVKQGSH